MLLQAHTCVQTLMKGSRHLSCSHPPTHSPSCHHSTYTYHGHGQGVSWHHTLASDSLLELHASATTDCANIHDQLHSQQIHAGISQDRVAMPWHKQRRHAYSDIAGDGNAKRADACNSLVGHFHKLSCQPLIVCLCHANVSAYMMDVPSMSNMAAPCILCRGYKQQAHTRHHTVQASGQCSLGYAVVGHPHTLPSHDVEEGRSIRMAGACLQAK